MNFMKLNSHALKLMPLFTGRFNTSRWASACLKH